MILSGCCNACDRGRKCDSKKAMGGTVEVDAKPIFDAASAAIPGFGPAAQIARTVLNAGLSEGESERRARESLPPQAVSDTARLWARVQAERIYGPKATEAEKSAAKQAYASWQDFQRRAKAGLASAAELAEQEALARGILSSAPPERPRVRVKRDHKKAIALGVAGVALVGAAFVIRTVL